ncbi:MAG: cyclic nucleotide-binding domain-containing protein [Planctomycetes bacterium]|nr:cyclic nucleotide-binding domain-containing protein [Planctomycetota bacterium]
MAASALLKKLAIFQDLNDEELGRILSVAEGRELPRGTRVFEEGSRGEEFYVIDEGVVEIAKNVGGGRRRVLQRLETGEVFGEMVIFEDVERSASALAESACRLTVFSRKRFLKVLRQDERLASRVLFRLLEVLAERLRHTNEKLNEAIVWGFQAQG